MTAVRRRPRGELPARQPTLDYGSVRVLPGGGVSIAILGKPAPQGSKNPSGQEANPYWAAWRKAINKVCSEGLPEDFVPLDGPLVAEHWFYFDPPQGWDGFSPPYTKTTYDLDKLQRATHDGIVEGGVAVDDSRICDVHAYKRYCIPGTETRAVVLIAPWRSTQHT